MGSMASGAGVAAAVGFGWVFARYSLDFQGDFGGVACGGVAAG